VFRQFFCGNAGNPQLIATPVFAAAQIGLARSSAEKNLQTLRQVKLAAEARR
jgi:hypothetical protein